MKKISEHIGFCSAPAAVLHKGFAGQEQGDASSLTARQMKILTAMVEAKTNHEIAEELGFSISTVRQETMKIYKVLGVSDRRAAAQVWPRGPQSRLQASAKRARGGTCAVFGAGTGDSPE